MRRAFLALLIAAPALAQTAAQKAELDRLFELLKQAPSEEVAAPVEGRIWRIWNGAASPAVGLLMQRGMRNMDAQAWAPALEDFDAALDLAPDFAEGWNKRATTRFMMGDLDGAVRDIQEVLKREPRHFGALAALSTIAEERRDDMAALRAYEAALAINPKMRGGEERLRGLKQKAYGEEM
jgi:tetratricopeptide (TPR) repeat protein